MSDCPFLRVGWTAWMNGTESIWELGRQRRRQRQDSWMDHVPGKCRGPRVPYALERGTCETFSRQVGKMSVLCSYSGVFVDKYHILHQEYDARVLVHTEDEMFCIRKSGGTPAPAWTPDAAILQNGRLSTLKNYYHSSYGSLINWIGQRSSTFESVRKSGIQTAIAAANRSVTGFLASQVGSGERSFL